MTHWHVICFRIWRSLCCVFPPAFGCCAHRKAGRTLFSAIFNLILLVSGVKSLKNVWNEQKGWKRLKKKYFDKLRGAHSTQKPVEIHNIPGSSLDKDDIYIVLEMMQDLWDPKHTPCCKARGCLLVPNKMLKQNKGHLMQKYVDKNTEGSSFLTTLELVFYTYF